MFNVYTLKNIKDRRYQLGSTYEQELKKKLRTTIDFNSKIIDFNEKLQAENLEYSKREKDIENKISQLNAFTTKVNPNLFLNESLILRVNVSLKPDILLKSNHLNQILKH